MLVETAQEAARRFPDRAALVSEAGLVLTYAELDAIASEVAGGLSKRGVGEGDVVSLVLPSIPEHFIAYLATAKLGAITAAVNPRLTSFERSAVLEVARPRVIITTRQLAPEYSNSGLSEVILINPAIRFNDLFRGVQVGDHSIEDLRFSDELGAKNETDRGVRSIETNLSRPVAIVFTSGTTGLPKGAVFCGSQIAFITKCDVGSEWGRGTNTLAGTALAHLGPMTKWAGGIQRGDTQHLSQSWKAHDALQRMSDLMVPGIGGVPSQLALMLAQPDFDQFDLTSIKHIVIGGGPATPELIRQARMRFNARLAVRYSCTEAGIGTGTSFDDPEEDAEISVGRPHPGVKLEIVGQDGKSVGRGEIGEVCLGSKATMSGYWNDPRATFEIMTESGLVRTGDLGWIDANGRLRLAGRLRERYVRGGFNVYPMEVESVLASHPDIDSIAIVGCSDPVMGEIGVAMVVPVSGRNAPSLDSLREFGSLKLASYKLPDRIQTLDAIPLTSMDKVDRRALEEMVEGGHQHADPSGLYSNHG